MGRREILKLEIMNDPLGRGYAGMSDEQVAASLRGSDRQENRSLVSGSEVLNTVNKGEFNALSATDQQRFWNVIHMGEINPFGVEAALLIDVFGAGSATITALGGIRKRTVSRGQELGLGFVGEGDVWDARNDKGNR